ncbi:histone-lysine N-methyltransferase SETMAR-like [Harpegnathos saltator]|uniref:histone-lysine N-methyltransferase SETMAR-like n=1 Tax=Harpegnathos saltator TaxID=610380 RepID=UPI000DBED24A|nr:histone-lysine N-methyltransferase SETMAR-like [Harpegnathos saltator]
MKCRRSNLIRQPVRSPFAPPTADVRFVQSFGSSLQSHSLQSQYDSLSSGAIPILHPPKNSKFNLQRGKSWRPCFGTGKGSCWSISCPKGPPSMQLHIDNARSHTARLTQDLFVSFGWNIVTHPPYSPDLAPSDYHLFNKLKEFLDGQRFSNDEEVMQTVTKWLQEVKRTVYDEGIQKLMPRLQKCIDLNGDYMGK